MITHPNDYLGDIAYWQLNPKQASRYLQVIAAYHARQSRMHADQAVMYANRAVRNWKITAVLLVASAVLQVVALTMRLWSP